MIKYQMNVLSEKKTVYLLFQTDKWQSNQSRVFCGVFDSVTALYDAAAENNLYHEDAEIVIIDAELNKFEEQ